MGRRHNVDCNSAHKLLRDIAANTLTCIITIIDWKSNETRLTIVLPAMVLVISRRVKYHSKVFI